jgi:diguanylate cyclase (GGDEF)-like protein/PAS domain S-box-containing protein
MHDHAESVGPPDDSTFRTLTELAPDFVAVTDSAGVISYVSPAFERVTGYPSAHALGKDVFEFLHSDDRCSARDAWAGLLGGRDCTAMTLRLRHRDGSFRDLETLARRSLDAPGQGRVLLNTRDVSQRVACQKALLSAREEANDLYDGAPCGYQSLDADGMVVRVNQTELRWLGRERAEVEGKRAFSELITAASVPAFARYHGSVAAGEPVDEVELELLHREGRSLPVLLSMSAEIGPEGRIAGWDCTLHDISERRRAQSEMHKIDRQLRALHAVNGALIHAEREPELLRDVCRICVELGGYRMAWVGFASEDETRSVVPAASFGFEEGYLASGGFSWADEERGRGPTGVAIRAGTAQVNRDFLSDPRMAPWREDALQRGYRSSVALPLTDSARVIGALMIYAADPDAFDPLEVGLLQDVAGDLAFGISALRARARQALADAQLQKLAFIDELTGLPNRNALLGALGRAAASLKSGATTFALLSINIVRFGDIQTGLGVRKADDVLRHFAVRVQGAMRPGEMLARSGGDEFAVLLPEAGAAQARDCCDRIEQALIEPFRLAGIPITVLVRVGAALAPEHGVDAEVLHLHSGMAGRQARNKGQTFALYGGPTEEETPQHLALISELRSAIEGDELIVHYQPKVDLKSGRIAGVEALVRWRHPRRGLVPPGSFIPLAEQTGLIRPLTYRVLRTALQQHRRWHCEGFSVPVAVNVSVHSLNDPDFLARIDQLLQEGTLDDTESLLLEITESAMMEEPARMLDLLVHLKERGVSVSIDDFGTGYSSLSYVARLPIEALKIDRSFVVEMMESERTRSVVAATIALARSLGIKTVAEGVEAKEQVDLLAALGCDQVQGYFLCRPVDADALRQWADGFSLADALTGTEAAKENLGA